MGANCHRIELPQLLCRLPWHLSDRFYPSFYLACAALDQTEYVYGWFVKYMLVTPLVTDDYIRRKNMDKVGFSNKDNWSALFFKIE